MSVGEVFRFVHIVNDFVGYVPFLKCCCLESASKAITLLIINYIHHLNCVAIKPENTKKKKNGKENDDCFFFLILVPNSLFSCSDLLFLFHPLVVDRLIVGFLFICFSFFFSLLSIHRWLISIHFAVFIAVETAIVIIDIIIITILLVIFG